MGLTRAQIDALGQVVREAEQLAHAKANLDVALNAALDAGATLRQVADAAGVEHSTISRRILRGELMKGDTP